jgi:glycogen debranching enzyme
MIDFGQQTCRDLRLALTREWLETEWVGWLRLICYRWVEHARRYHGLLIAATRPPVGRMVLLSKHEGTVWPWLLGPFAYIKVNEERHKPARGADWFESFRASLGKVSEIFDGDFPQHPRGCGAQAWSVAELLRAAVEDVFTAPSRQTGDGRDNLQASFLDNA